MEHHKTIKVERRSLLSFDSSINMYRFAQEHVQRHRKEEFDSIHANLIRASRRSIYELEEAEFIREYVWAVYVSGFKAAHVSKKWKPLLQAHAIEDSEGAYIPIAAINIGRWHEVAAVWANLAKFKAVHRTREMIWEVGWPKFRDEYLAKRCPKEIGRLPFMGKALRYHLARNLGNIDSVKPDVHMVRIAEHYGHETPQRMCEFLSPQPAGITDLIIWMAAVDNGTKL